MEYVYTYILNIYNLFNNCHFDTYRIHFKTAILTLLEQSIGLFSSMLCFEISAFS